MRHRLRNQRGNVGGWILTIIILILVAAGGYLTVLRFGILPAPPALAQQTWMKSFLPPAKETVDLENPAVSEADSYRQQLVFINGEKMALEARVKALEEQVSQLQQDIVTREDEIARLTDTINLASDQNITNVALVYENMDATDAASILSNLGADSASLILANMRESKAADVLAAMDETLATQITELMAGFTEHEAPPPPATQPPTQPPVMIDQGTD
ncbi:MAG: hypothetical protein NTY09_12750 [bacterium]|nr:hypothetical protein [bacterium]